MHAMRYCCGSMLGYLGGRCEFIFVAVPVVLVLDVSQAGQIGEIII